MVSECKNCEDGGVLYDKRNGQRCAKCGWRWEPKTGMVEERPSKPHDAVCGEVLNGYPNHDDVIPKMVDTMCVDDTRCQITPKTMKKDESGDWLAVCTKHKE